MSNFICVNRPLRFDPSLVTFCKNSLRSARLSKGYLRAVVLAPNARHLVACATSLPPWEGAMPIAIDQGLRRKKSPSSNLDLFQRCSTSRAPLIRVDATSVNQIDVRIRSGQVLIGPDLGLSLS